ncbi:transcriptional repressor [Yinghuangia sp. ASG 101]|uniref:Fur family transcriptional regulator n=1 Tax=Yinghuangia sp. ASG 101 TaxID=2896848 RepID=UPI001E2BE3D9|nr:transcriptional repressor [Yinghuangia sp. ASG 101]UGQ11913.1 transcriptional repressor [Yinghuangia sp. ASG 101]
MAGKSATGTGRRARAAPGRRAVANALADGQTFLSARRLHARLVADGIDVGLSTVYRALHELTREGRADFVRDNTGERLYRHRPAHGHRHYLLCRACGFSRALEAGPVPRWVDGIAARAGFSETTHSLTIAGICRSCAGR